MEDRLAQKKYNEYKVTSFDSKGNPTAKEKTARGHVVISAWDAKLNNRPGKLQKTKLYYELAEEPKKESKKEDKKPGRPAKNDK